MIDRVEPWFADRGWKPFPFQRDCWRAYLDGDSGLVHSTTGSGKTYALWLGPVAEALASRERGAPLRVLWITPLRALASDTVESLRRPIDDLALPWTVELRTGDTATSRKVRQRARPPSALVTTPESATILLSYPESRELFAGLRCVVVDEWHELMGTKRGVQTELALARLRALAPGLRTWGLSATLGNLEQAATTLLGASRARPPRLIRGAEPKPIEVETLLPDEIERYPWAGHLGTRLAPKVAQALDRAATTLLFTNTRSQAEIWFRELLLLRPDLMGRIALHHASLDRAIRDSVEGMLRAQGRPDSRLRCVVCTSSLDLGVDFAPVDQVIQVGSPRGVARLIQRAGRSGHRPGAPSRIVCVPTHSLELLEFAAARDALAAGALESRTPIHKPLDVLAQHVVTVAMGGGFTAPELLAEVRTTAAYHDLTDEEWGWVMDFARQGGSALSAYPRYARIIPDHERWTVASRPIATTHRMSIGAIVADEAVAVKYASGRSLGSIEESFVSRLRTGDRFVFAGRVLSLRSLKGMTAIVAPARARRGAVPRWNGGKMPLSSQLADAVRRRLDHAASGVLEGPEMERLRPLLDLQAEVSRIPRPDELLIEIVRDGPSHHAFLFPFAGRLAHEGLGAVLSFRLSRREPISVHAVATDYGVELLSDRPLDLPEEAWRSILTADNLLDDLLASMNATELARRQFREVARIAGLTFQGYPGRKSPARHMQASSDMFFDVFRDFDPGNLLLDQAAREVLDQQLEVRRIREALDAMKSAAIVLVHPRQVTPLAFPLYAESLRATTVTSESWEHRVRRMVATLERAGARREHAHAR